MLFIINYKEDASQNNNEVSFHATESITHEKTNKQANKNQGWDRCWEKRTLTVGGNADWFSLFEKHFEQFLKY